PAEIGAAGAGPDPVPDHDRGAGPVQVHALETVAPRRRQKLMPVTDSTITLGNPIYRRRRLFNRVMLGLSGLALASGLFWLTWTVVPLLLKGGTALSPTLLWESTPPPGGDGGLMNAIVGSVMMSAVGTLIGTPIGVLA